MIKERSNPVLLPAYHLVSGIKKREYKTEAIDINRMRINCSKNKPIATTIAKPEAEIRIGDSLDLGNKFESLSNLNMKRRTFSSTSFFILNIPQKTSKRSSIKNVLNYSRYPNKTSSFINENISMIAKNIEKPTINISSIFKSKIAPKIKPNIQALLQKKPFYSRQITIQSHITEDEETFRPKAKYNHMLS